LLGCYEITANADMKIAFYFFFFGGGGGGALMVTMANRKIDIQ